MTKFKGRFKYEQLFINHDKMFGLWGCKYAMLDNFDIDTKRLITDPKGKNTKKGSQ